MRRLACLTTTIAALAIPAAAGAAPIPGAHYEGTTDQNYPIAFDVAPDGSSITNVVTSYNVFCTGGQGLQIFSTNSPYAFPIAGDTISGEDADHFPRLTMHGTFSSPQDGGGTFDGSSGGFSGGMAYFCNVSDVLWVAHTNAVVPGGGGSGADPDEDPPGGTGGGGGSDPGDGVPGGSGGPAAGAPAITISFPKGVLLKPSLKNGFVVGVAVDQPAALAGKVTLAAKDAKRYGLGKRARVIARDTWPTGGADSALEFKPSKAVARKLRKAKKLKLLLVVKATRADGVSSTAKKTLAFK